MSRLTAILEVNPVGHSKAEIAHLILHPRVTVYQVIDAFTTCDETTQKPRKILSDKFLTPRFMAGL